MNKQWIVKSRPQGEPDFKNFDLVESKLPPVNEGQVLLRTIYLSLDPYMRGRLNEGASYAEAVKLGDVMCGETIAEVIESKSEAFKSGDLVLSYHGWQEFAGLCASESIDNQAHNPQ